MKPNKKEKGRGNARYRLQADEVEIIREYRRIKEEAEFEGVNPNDVHSGWIKSKKSSLKIASFGTFSTKKTPERIGRNPKTKQEFIISERSKLKFTASNKLRNLIN